MITVDEARAVARKKLEARLGEWAGLVAAGAPSPAVSSGPSPVMAPAPSPSAPVTRLPDDFDPFADLLGSAKAAPTPPTAPRLPGDLDLMADLRGLLARDPLAFGFALLAVIDRPSS